MILPEPKMYKDWQAWAVALNSCLSFLDPFMQTVYFQPCLSTKMPKPVAGGMVYVIDTDVYMKSNGTTWAAV